LFAVFLAPFFAGFFDFLVVNFLDFSSVFLTGLLAAFFAGIFAFFLAVCLFFGAYTELFEYANFAFSGRRPSAISCYEERIVRF
jgi:hypothetical protein